jgi:hypothetical protein
LTDSSTKFNTMILGSKVRLGNFLLRFIPISQVILNDVLFKWKTMQILKNKVSPPILLCHQKSSILFRILPTKVQFVVKLYVNSQNQRGFYPYNHVIKSPPYFSEFYQLRYNLLHVSTWGWTILWITSLDVLQK